MGDSISLAFLGYGYWGKNVLRTLMREPRANVKWACDISPAHAARLQSDYPSLAVTTDYFRAMADPAVQAVVLATPAETHCQLAQAALEFGKHVFVEKPMAAGLGEALDLAAVVRRRDLIFQVGHVFKYAPPVRKLRESLRHDRLGRLLYVTANRASLGPRLRTDVNIVWDYAIHDLYILMYLLDAEPERVSARGACNFYPNVEDTVLISLHFPSGTWALVHSSWAAPTRRRDMTVVGDNGMAVYDDTQPQKLVLYKRGYAAHSGLDHWGNLNWRLFDEGIEVPELAPVEPLAAELAEFLDCIAEARRPLSDVEDGLRTIRLIQAVNLSLANRGQEVSLNECAAR